MSNWSSEWLCWIYRHETLTSAFLALVAAGLTILVLVRQIRQSDRQHKLERQKKLEAARAVMPLALSRLVDYAESALNYSLIGKSKISSRETHDQELPHVPDDVISVLREVIEYADDGLAGHALRKLISEVQYHHARMRDLPRQETTVQPTGVRRIGMPENYDQGIWDAIHLYLHASAFFDYARFETDIMPSEPTRDEVRKRMDFIGIPIPATHAAV